jgi:cobalamin biosynthesis Mg chelatase CobN
MDYQRNFMDSLAGGLQFGQQVKQQRDQNQLRGLASLAQGAPVEQRQSLLSQMAGINPEYAQAQKKAWSADDEADREELVRMARFIKQAPPEQQPAAYASILPKLRERGMQAPEWGPDSQDMILKTVDALAGAYGDSQSGTGVQSTYVDGQGNRVAIMRDGSTAVLGQNAPNNQIIDTGNGFYGVNKGSLSASPVVVGGQPQQPSIAPGNYQTPEGMIRVGDLTPDQQALMMEDIRRGQASDEYRLPPRDVSPQQFGGGQQLRSEPKQENTPAGYRRTADGNLEFIPGGPADPFLKNERTSPTAAKPIPVGALNQVLGAQDALGATRVISDIIGKHTSRIQDGSLVIGPVDTIGAKLRTTLGRSTPQDVNLNEWEADKTKIVNESLRLNKGVQTEGDAQRAVQELMGASDQQTAIRALKRLTELNKRAVELQQQKLQTIYRNYNRGPDGEQIQAQPEGNDRRRALLDKY